MTALCLLLVLISKSEQLMSTERPLSYRFGILPGKKDSRLSLVVIIKVLTVLLSLMILLIEIHSPKFQNG